MPSIVTPYRLTYLLSPKLEKEAVVEANQKLVSFLEKKGKKVKTEKEITRQNLAYPIQNERQAYLADITFDFPPTELPALKKHLTENTNILRFLLTKVRQRVAKKRISEKALSQLKKEEKKEEGKEETVDEKLNRILAS